MFYEDMNGLKRLVKSADDFFIIFVDGRWTGWDSRTPLSQDGSREYIQSLDNVCLIDAPDLIEYQARNKYIEKAEELGFKYCLVIDSDEFIDYLDLKQFEADLKRDEDSYRYIMKQDYGEHVPYYRLHKSTARHKECHQQVYIDDKPVFRQDSRIIKGLVTWHEKSFRSQEREQERVKYYYKYPKR